MRNKEKQEIASSTSSEKLILWTISGRTILISIVLLVVGAFCLLVRPRWPGSIPAQYFRYETEPDLKDFSIVLQRSSRVPPHHRNCFHLPAMPVKESADDKVKLRAKKTVVEEEPIVPLLYWHDEDLVGANCGTDCRRPSWARRHFPTCNDFHLLDLSREFGPDAGSVEANSNNYDGVLDSYLVSQGFYRDVWVLDQYIYSVDSSPGISNNERQRHQNGVKAILMTRFRSEFDYGA